MTEPIAQVIPVKVEGYNDVFYTPWDGTILETKVFLFKKLNDWNNKDINLYLINVILEDIILNNETLKFRTCMPKLTIRIRESKGDERNAIEIRFILKTEIKVTESSTSTISVVQNGNDEKKMKNDNNEEIEMNKKKIIMN